MMADRKPTTVHLYPLPDAFVPDVVAQECDVTPEEAERLLSFSPPAFSTTKPRGYQKVQTSVDDAVPETVEPEPTGNGGDKTGVA